MQQYLDFVDDILASGTRRMDRTGVGTTSVFGRQLRFDLSQGFPLLTTKKMFFKGIVEELLWFLRGESNIASLVQQGVHIWDAWATDSGEIGPLYGTQWRSWPGRPSSSYRSGMTRAPIDQIRELIEGLRTRPFSRRHVVSAWNPEFLPDESLAPQVNAACGKMALAPCHCLFQFYVEPIEDSERLRLSCQLYQRSADVILGVPFNIASYALLTHMIAHCVDMEPGDFVHTFGDAHIYSNHTSTYEIEQCRRAPLALPTLTLNPAQRDLFAFTAQDITLQGYESYPALKYTIAV